MHPSDRQPPEQELPSSAHEVPCSTDPQRLAHLLVTAAARVLEAEGALRHLSSRSIERRTRPPRTL